MAVCPVLADATAARPSNIASFLRPQAALGERHRLIWIVRDGPHHNSIQPIAQLLPKNAHGLLVDPFARLTVAPTPNYFFLRWSPMLGIFLCTFGPK